MTENNLGNAGVVGACSFVAARRVARHIMHINGIAPHNEDISLRMFPSLMLKDNWDAVTAWVIDELHWVDQSRNVVEQLVQVFAKEVMHVDTDRPDNDDQVEW